jgi:hypothetical protein
VVVVVVVLEGASATLPSLLPVQPCNATTGQQTFLMKEGFCKKRFLVIYLHTTEGVEGLHSPDSTSWVTPTGVYVAVKATRCSSIVG